MYVYGNHVHPSTSSYITTKRGGIDFVKTPCDPFVFQMYFYQILSLIHTHTILERIRGPRTSGYIFKLKITIEEKKKYNNKLNAYNCSLYTLQKI